VSARAGLRFFFVEALVASTLSLLLLAALLFASLRAERRSRVLAAERAASALAAHARHVLSSGARVIPFVDASGLALEIDDETGRVVARARVRAEQHVEVLVSDPRKERAP
jgi:hypothetical protein